MGHTIDREIETLLEKEASPPAAYVLVTNLRLGETEQRSFLESRSQLHPELLKDFFHLWEASRLLSEIQAHPQMGFWFFGGPASLSVEEAQEAMRLRAQLLRMPWPQRFAGREPEGRAVVAAIGGEAPGRVVVHGPPGIGTSRLLLEALRHLHDILNAEPTRLQKSLERRRQHLQALTPEEAFDQLGERSREIMDAKPLQELRFLCEAAIVRPEELAAHHRQLIPVVGRLLHEGDQLPTPRLGELAMGAAKVFGRSGDREALTGVVETVRKTQPIAPATVEVRKDILSALEILEKEAGNEGAMGLLNLQHSLLPGEEGPFRERLVWHASSLTWGQTRQAHRQDEPVPAEVHHALEGLAHRAAEELHLFGTQPRDVGPSRGPIRVSFRPPARPGGGGERYRARIGQELASQRRTGRQGWARAQPRMDRLPGDVV